MTKERQEEVLAAIVRTCECWQSGSRPPTRSIQASWIGGENVAQCIGFYTPDELEALAWFMRERQEVKEKT